MTATLQPETKSSSRRALLAGALGGIGAWAAAALGRPSPMRAAGNDGAIIHVGDTYLDVRTGTYLSDAANNATVFSAVSSSAGGFGNGVAIHGGSGSNYGVRGTSDTSSGVYGQSDSSIGVHGQSGSNIGVFGYSPTSIGVFGNSYASDKPAILGQANGSSTGVLGVSGQGVPTAKPKTGVYGYANQDNFSRGVIGESPAGIGVYGISTTGYGGYFAGRVYTNKWYELGEVANPATPLANRARLFVPDSAGKTQLCVRFHTGAVQVIKTEP